MVKDIVEQLNEAKILQISGDFMEDLTDELYENYFENSDVVAENLNIDKHRHYELATNVYSINGDLVGVEYIGDMFSESSEWEDCCHTLRFFEVEEVQTVTYKEVN